MSSIDDACPGRRCVLAALAVGAATSLTGCAVYGEQRSAAGAAESPAGTTLTVSSRPTSAAPSDDESASPSDDDASAAPSSTAATAPLARVDDIPVGGGVVLAGAGIVLTRPSDGEVKAFSSTCTHAGCQVDAVSNSTINCPCHGSRFALTDGAPVAGPAGRPLPPVAIVVSDGAVRKA
jgi:Rieske Fe-S protein